MRAQEAKIAVYGAGAMGTVLGAFLTLGGLKNVYLITRNQAHIQAMQKESATVRCVADGVEKRVKVQALLPEQMEKYDLIFLMTKQRHNQETAEWLLPHLTPDGIVCTTQNGLPEKSIASVIGAERTYGAATSFGAGFLENGVVEMTSKLDSMSMEVGGYEDSDKLPLLVEVLSFAGKATENAEGFVKGTDNLLGARWSKLAINAAFSGLSVITGMTFGEVAKRRKTRRLALGILRECMAVAKASGVKLAPMQGHDMEKLLGGTTPWKRFVAYLLLPFAMKKHKKLRSGMLKDIEGGRKCDIDFVNGAVVAEGRAAGVPTPLCERVVELTHGIENGLYEIGYENVDFFE